MPRCSTYRFELAQETEFQSFQVPFLFLFSFYSHSRDTVSCIMDLSRLGLRNQKMEQITDSQSVSMKLQKLIENSEKVKRKLAENNILMGPMNSICALEG
ncbi:hypothetical protein ANTRET_LOCUS4113 [Anthophora retusa]